MYLSKPSVALSSYNGLHSLGQHLVHLPQTSQIHTSSSAPSAPTPLSPSRRRRTRPHRSPQVYPSSQTRSYACIIDDPSSEPLTWPTPKHPTPYEIFQLPPTAPYSKHRFYQLVKLYHPDRHHCPSSHPPIPLATKLERYRLVVAANDILSCSAKRSAYDRHGAGWGDQTPVFHPHYGPWRSNTSAYSNNSGWSHHKRSRNNRGGDDDSPHQNATWEDWERWYQRDAKGPQEPHFFANGAFVSVVVMLAVLGGVGQATRVGNHTVNLMEERERLHDETSRELMRRRSESLEAMRGGERRDGRIRRFLEERERDPRYLEMEEERSEGGGDGEGGWRRLLQGPAGQASEPQEQEEVEGSKGDILYDEGHNRER